MLDVVTGPFQPALESALLQEIRQLKSSDSFSPIAIVVPSQVLRRRLQWYLCIENKCSLLNVHFLTFHQLTLRLYHEQLLHDGADGICRLQLVHDLFFEHLVNSLIKREKSAYNQPTGIRSAGGVCTAFWNTIRDLKEAMVDPEMVLRGVQEGMFAKEDVEQLQTLFAFYAKVQERSRSLNVGSADDLASMMNSCVRESSFLSRACGVCYYGFYDLTQVQLSLLESIAAIARVTVYFPLSEDHAFTFSRRFFERHLCSGNQRTFGPNDRFPHVSAETGKPESRRVQVMNTVGAEDELIVVCKEIVNLMDNEQYRYEDIGVVARTLEPYQFSLQRSFDEHGIPFVSSATRSALQEPLIKHLFVLSRLTVTDFYWRDVLDLLASPFYRLERVGVTREEIQPESWHVTVRTLGIHRGQSQWNRLAALLQVRPGQEWGEAHQDDEGRKVSFAPEQVRLLTRLLADLMTDCQMLPIQGTVGALTAAFLKFAQNHLALPGFMGSPAPDISVSPLSPILSETIEQALTLLFEMDRVQETVTWEQWTQLFLRVLKRCSIAIEPDRHAGVRVLDAMTARGLPFRALFLVGLNENVFPRFIREDAFLRDRSRRILEETFGYKIDEKLAGYDEERLLFHLLTQAAHQRLYFVYQRADGNGRSLMPSSYIAEFLSANEALKMFPELIVPRRWTERFAHPLFDSQFLTREELARKLIWEGKDPTDLLEEARREPLLFQRGWEALKEIERHGRRLGFYDGCIRSADINWQKGGSREVTATSLELYARCPFQFFAKRILGAQSIRVPMVEDLSAAALGELCHAALHCVYRGLIQADWPEQEIALTCLEQKIRTVLDDLFVQYAGDHATGYFLTWQLAKEMITELVTCSVQADQQAYREHGFRPLAFEINAEGELTLLGKPFASMKVRGRLDRIDFRKDPPGLRIVDYKFQTSSRMKNENRDLLRAGIRGIYLQPPLYALMSRFHHQRLNQLVQDQGVRPDGVDFVYLAPRWNVPHVRSEFDASGWHGSSGQQLKNTLRTLLQGMRSGQYFILPGEHCRYCEISSACRRYHGPSWARARGASLAHQLRRLGREEKHGA